MIALAQEIEWPEAFMWIGIAFAIAIVLVALLFLLLYLSGQ